MRRERVDEQLKLGAFFHPTGNHVASWLDESAQIDAGTNFRHYAELARTAERGKFDLMFLADAVATRDGNQVALRRWPQYMAYFDPLTLLSAIAPLTKHLGLCATATTSYNEPYHIARKFASLDLISGGRAGWNVVTSSNQSEAFNFGREAHYEHDARYDRAVEFTDVVFGLWDSWDPDAFIRDRATALYYDPEKLHELNHKGKYFSVKGPLNVARSPQGRPVIFQAGSSEAGRELAAQTAEGVFTPQHTLGGAQAFYRDLKGRMDKFGRRPDQLKIMPGLNPIVGKTMAEARDKHEHLNSLIHPDVGLEVLSYALGKFDLRGYDLDGPLPDAVQKQSSNAGQTSFNNVLAWAREEKLTIRQLYLRFAGARGQRTLVGTPTSIADEMQAWFEGHGADGFLVHPATLPGGLDDFVDLVVPELQDRGLFRHEYAGTTLRDNLGLDVPESRYAA
ncbi:MAG TPA: LLM class flavin-dependent oxidoreductase [Rhodopila sp.]|uniref:LLM class flavin-dependent oxidoreductase n=1 Tax=Rhodopila sp. TaxID=2480087 RepID=UPI002C27E54D|nr:LLM class flavin-dependent oxidoreductase [Rhodopila sp.]HVY15828.1 LLM class flavin-dependent oxidoreductase [Rhodopila sp.]